MKALSTILLISLFCLSAPLNYLCAGLSEGPEDEKKVEEKIFQSLKEAEDYLQSLLKEREILTGDFYGINITAYRYSHIFYPLSYIGYRIKKIDEKIKKTKLQIDKLKNKDRILGHQRVRAQAIPKRIYSHSKSYSQEYSPQSVIQAPLVHHSTWVEIHL